MNRKIKTSQQQTTQRKNSFLEESAGDIGKINPANYGLRKWIRIESVLQAFGISRATAYKMIAQGVLPPPMKPFGPGSISVWDAEEIRNVQLSMMQAAGRNIENL